MKYHTLFEVKKSDGYRASIPLDCILGIHEDVINSVVAVTAGDDVESSESYKELRDRFERFLLENQQYEENMYDEREKKRDLEEKNPELK